MGTITAGIGLISGIDTATLIDQLIALESRIKFPLEERIIDLEARKIGLLDINSRLLNLQTASSNFRTNSIFQSAFATSSDESVLTATTGTLAQPGSFQFIVKQLVTSSQKLSKGFADRDTTPLNLSSMSFEFGQGTLGPDTDLVNLNGGAGVARGKIVITDSIGATTVDLSDVTTLNEVLDRINTSGANVSASVDGDHLVVTELSAGSIQIADAAGFTTAADLGIVGSDNGALTGTDINTIGGSTALNTLNDGTGVMIRNGVPDLEITLRNSIHFSIDLGRVDRPIDDDTELEDLNNGAGVTIADGEPDFAVISTTGETVNIDLGQLTDENGDVIADAVETVGELRQRVNDQLDDEHGAGQVVLTVNADGSGFVLTDNLAGLGDLEVISAGPNGADTAQDLGIFTGIGGGSGNVINGSLVPNTVDIPAAVTLQNVIDRINDALDTLDNPNAGRLVASIAADGVSLLITDNSAGGDNLIIEGFTADGGPSAAVDLGIDTGPTGVASDTVDGARLVAGLNSVLVGSLNGGAGLGGDTTLDITDRNGGSTSLTLDETASLNDIINQINNDSNIEITASLNDLGTGLLITDTSGGIGNLIVDGNAADDLGISTGVAGVLADTVIGANLQLQYVDASSLLSDLNYGQGVGTGTFRITDGLGQSADVNIGSDSRTLHDIIQEINSRGLAINARINDNGDGIVLDEDMTNFPGATSFVAIRVDATSGSVATDLNIAGVADSVGGSIDGSYERVVELETGDGLDEVVSKINDAGIPISASVLNTGTGSTPYHLTFTSGISGRAGELIVDTGGVDLGLSTMAKGQDAKVFLGSDDAATGVLITNDSNTLDGVIQGLTIDLLTTSDDPVTVTVERDVVSIRDAVSQFVTTFNDVIGTVNVYDFFDVESESRGALLGDPTVARIRNTMYRTVNQSALGLDTQFEFLSEVGITVGDGGLLTFDASRFDEAYEIDPRAVEQLFAAFESTTSSTEEIAPGITVDRSDETVTMMGFGDIFDRLMDDMTDPFDGTVTLADEAFEAQIELTEDRIEVIDQRLEARRQQLEREFAAMEQALAVLQAQSGALLSLAASFGIATS